MSGAVEQWIVAGIVAACALHLARRLWRSARRRDDAGCGGGCSACPASSTRSSDSIVPLAALTAPADRPPRPN